MNFFILTILLSSTALNASRTQYSKIVDEINQAPVGWTAALSADIPYDDEGELRGRLGAIQLTDTQAAVEIQNINAFEASKGRAPVIEVPSNRPRKLQTYYYYNRYVTKNTTNTTNTTTNKNTTNTTNTTNGVVSAYPDSLDLRTKYPLCTSISTVRNQASCGSCWAFATMNSLTDRWCIAKSIGGIVNQKYFSVEDVLECCADCNGGSGNGCNGGMPSYALKYARDTGVVTGDMKTLSAGFCKPYFLDGTTVSGAKAPACSNSCTNKGYLTGYTLDRTKITGYNMGKGESAMIAALNNGGTVAVSFTVYQDFYSYKSGIYSFKTGSVLGGHAVRLIGYGVENGVKYWLLANSWGKNWGESGFFRMRRGTNECGIETQYVVYALI